MKIGIIGLGFVGLSLASVLGSKNYEVIGMDSDPEKLSLIEKRISPFYEPNLIPVLRQALKKRLSLSASISSLVNDCKLIFITVGTPQLKDGEIDLSSIKRVSYKISKLLAKTKNDPVIVIKSTVIPSTTEKMILPILERSGKKVGKDVGLITNPEFLREGKAIEDTSKPHVVVVGGKNDKFMNRIKKFYEILHKGTPIITTNYQTAEVIKYANNSFLATKISFINQMANLCQVIPGANIDLVAKAIGLDPRIGNLFLNAGPGYGGSCLPKDIKAIINFSARAGIKPLLLMAVEEVNNQQIKNIISIVKKTLGKIKGKKITILGLTFKPDTDDIRDSVSIKLVKLLLQKGAKIKVHDPKALKNTRMVFRNKISYAHSLSESLKDSECGIIMTAWKQYTHINKEIKLMKNRVIVDSRRLLTKQNLDVDYYAPLGIG